MLERDEHRHKRAPLKREAPLPLVNPGIRRRAPTPRSPLNIDNIFKNKQDISFDQNAGFHGGASARRKGYRLAMWSLFASVIDGLVLVATSCLFILSFSLIVQTQVGALLRTLGHNSHQLIFFAEVFLVFSWIYMIFVRSVMGASIGEWACDLRLGQPHERLRTSYVFRVAARSTLILLTGVLTLPLLSMLLGVDLAGKISRLKLFSLK